MSLFGPVFGDNILKDKKTTFSTSNLIARSRYYRLSFFTALIAVGFSILFIRLFSLTMVQGQTFKNLASENRIREINLTAPRGIIYDRNKNPLVRNIPIYTTTDGDIFFNKPNKVDELFFETSTREYIYGEIFGQLVGYVGEVNQNDLLKLPVKSGPKILEPLKLKDQIGKMGIEENFDGVLRGKDGVEMIEVNAGGNYIRTLGRIEATSGNNINLNVDLELQKVSAELLKDKKGAVVVSDPMTGAILALYSSPSFDPNKILKIEDIDAIFNNPLKPLFNRSISGVYPPGSTFKIISAIAGLESGEINKEMTIEDTGILKVGERFSYANWYFTQYGKTEGAVNLIKAIQRSNDIYFYKAGEKTGIENLAKFAKKMGVGSKLGIDLQGEAEGVMPDPIWKEKFKKESWYLGDTYHAAIGQGDILTTPLQVNFWTNIIANGGKLCKPKLTNSGKTECINLDLKKENIEIVKEGMIRVCEEGGTGWPLFNFKAKSERIRTDNIDFFETANASGSAEKQIAIRTACKTGTAEYGDPKNKTHAWFTIFAPVAKPQISVTVLLEEGGEGSTNAGPIARDILKKWFEK